MKSYSESQKGAIKAIIVNIGATNKYIMNDKEVEEALAYIMNDENDDRYTDWIDSKNRECIWYLDENDTSIICYTDNYELVFSPSNELLGIAE